MKTATSAECLDAQKRASVGIDDALKNILTKKAEGRAAPMYQVLLYFMGFLDEKFQPEKPGAGGKRFRPALCLYIAEAYGARDAAFEAALAIELFHNFTLIHDDVEDRDETRRNRPTVWKLWGVNHAINSGDALHILASDLALKAGPAVGEKLLAAFAEVIEGQYMDFELADRLIGDEMVNEENALMVNAKKTGALIAVAAETAGIAGQQSVDECAHLREYGMALGMAFQLADDYRSVWETKLETGKDSHSDIREHKRTLPFFAAHKELEGSAKGRLEELYGLSRQLSEAEIVEALMLVEKTSARTHVLSKIKEYAAEAQAFAEKLSVQDETKSILMGLVDMLMPHESGVMQ